MSYPWARAFASSSYSASLTRSYHDSEIEDYIDSDDEPPRNSYLPKQPTKPTPKPKNQTPKKTQKSRDDYVEKVEFFSCKLCKKTYNSKGGLNRHFTTAHGLEKDAKEPKKPKGSGGSKALNTWAPSRRFRCTHCGKELTSEAFLQRHMATHDKSVAKPKFKQTKKVATNVNINVYNTNIYNSYSMPSNDVAVARRTWDWD